MIYKGLMGRDEIDYLTNRFTEIKFANLRVGTETLATKEMLSEKDISSSIYESCISIPSSAGISQQEMNEVEYIYNKYIKSSVHHLW